MGGGVNQNACVVAVAIDLDAIGRYGFECWE
jgi:hypothetical protein